MNRAFQVHHSDNVATLLNDASSGRVEIVGSPEYLEVALLEPVKLGHKVALMAIESGDVVVKYGIPIGHATRAIARGEWVHLHNLASDLDERSGSLDLHTGKPSDTSYV